MLNVYIRPQPAIAGVPAIAATAGLIRRDLKELGVSLGRRKLVLSPNQSRKSSSCHRLAERPSSSSARSTSSFRLIQNASSRGDAPSLCSSRRLGTLKINGSGALLATQSARPATAQAASRGFSKLARRHARRSHWRVVPGRPRQSQQMPSSDPSFGSCRNPICRVRRRLDVPPGDAGSFAAASNYWQKSQ